MLKSFLIFLHPFVAFAKPAHWFRPREISLVSQSNKYISNQPLLLLGKVCVDTWHKLIADPATTILSDL